MPRHFLNYWRQETANYQINQNEPFNHTASEQLNKVEVGDVVWIATVQSNHLLLIGRLLVDWKGSYQDAQRELQDDDLWEASWHVIAKKGTAERHKKLDITQLIDQLRFQSSQGKDHLTLKEGRIDVFQLRSIRLLAKDTENLLDKIWYGEDLIPENLDDALADEDFKTYTEGGLVVRTSIQRQRSRALVSDKKAEFQQEHGRLKCEVCDFDFGDVYGDDLADGYIEAHHINHLGLSDGERKETTDGLILLCANCHRMAHRKPEFVDIKELKKRVKAHAKQ